MGKASITIDISSVFNGNGVADAQKSLAGLKSSISKMEKAVSSGTDSVSSDLAKFGQSWEDAGKRTEEVGKKIAGIGDSLTKYVTVPMTAFGTYAGKAAVDFDTAMANVRKVSNMTDDQLQKLADSALKLSTTQPVSAETILNVEALGIQLGMAEDNIESFAQVATGLDIATNMNAEQAATEMARFKNIVGMSEEDLGRYGSVIVDLGNKMATTESEISNTAMRFASAGHQAGLSEDEILAMAASMSSLGIKAEMGGSALSQVFVAISKSVAMGGDDLEAFASAAGMSAEEFRAAWQDDAAGAFTTLLQGIHDASEAGQDMNVILGDLGITQIRNSDVMRRMSGSVDLVKESLDNASTAWEQNTALQAEVDQRNESMASKLEVLKNKFDEIAIKVGGPMVDAIISFADSMSPVIEKVADAARAFADMDEEGQRNIVMWAGIAAAAGPVLSTFGRVQQTVGKGMQAFGQFQEKVAVVNDAMLSLDGAHLRVYGSSKSVASQLGISGNAAVQAAGGVDKYLEAWDAMHTSAGKVQKAEEKIADLMEQSKNATGDAKTSLLKRASALESDRIAAEGDFKANAKLVSAFGESTTEAEKAAKGIGSLEGPLKEVKDGMSNSGKVLSDYQKGLQASSDVAKTAGATLGDSLANGARLAASSVGNFIKACAPMLAMTAAVAIIGGIASAFQDMSEREKMASDATRSFSDLMAEASGSVSSAEPEIESLADSIARVHSETRDSLESLTSFQNSVVDSFADIYANAAPLDSYVATIEELGNQSGLTAGQQAQLTAAVEGYNQITGESYKVTDAQNGIITDQNGVLVENTDAIADNADAWKRRAELAAAQQLLTEAYKGQMEAEQAVTDAQNAYNEQLEQTMRLNPGMTEQEAKKSFAMQGVTKDLENAQAALDGYNIQIEGLTAKSLVAASALSEDLKGAVEQLPPAFQEAGINMASSLQQGIEDGTVNAQAATEMMNSLIKLKLDELPPEAGQTGVEFIDALSNEIAAGNISVEEATALLNDAADGEISKLPEAMSKGGQEATAAFALSISSGSSDVEIAASELEESAESGVDGLPDYMKNVGTMGTTGLAGGMDSGKSKVGKSAAGIRNEASKMKDVGDMHTSGFHLVSNFADGISAAGSKVGNAAATVAGIAGRYLKFTVPDDGPWSGAERGGETSGLHLAQNWARGIEHGIPLVEGAGAKLALAASQPVPLSYGGANTSSQTEGSKYGSTVNYVLNIDGARVQSDARLMELVEAAFTAYSDEMEVM